MESKPVECLYHLLSLPADIVLRTDENAEAGDPNQIKWSGTFPVPAIGTKVRTNVNNLGYGRIVAYFIEHGYLGVQVLLDIVPAWKVQQDKAMTRKGFEGQALLFGVEVHHV